MTGFVYNVVFLIAILAGFAHCQSENALDLDFDKDKIKDEVKNQFGVDLPDLPENFNQSSLPKAEDVERVLKEKCEKQGALNAVEALKEQQETARACLESHVNVTKLQAELEVAKKTGSMDEVFAGYCMKWPEVRQCFDEATVTVRSCMDDKEKKAFNRSLDIITELQEFMCFKGGDRLAMFVAEKGEKCVEDHKDGVLRCLNATLGGRIPETDDFSTATLPAFLFTAQDCTDFDTIRACVNVELEKCENSTPANLVDALFKFLKKHMPCNAEIKGGKSEEKLISRETTSSSFAAKTSVALTMLAFAFLRLV